ncbi:MULTISPECIES: hypothetical protein [Chitinophaga]|uniref:hypothetical protein n=1 Tax=Chitinophaga TaxID=79328 RepID=UPI000DBA3587|nr:hypothetical protein [Chitinophaga ginsengisegetis]MDR6569211.1 hypothetical protein [Chitinophaga ginsengisegetis]MDR6648759.1 hypothetical protein [Chitinophaga ginsengisegetis]MDR6655293.1 hypothetical protein [Chitinophaga ginsengisegetis]
MKKLICLFMILGAAWRLTAQITPAVAVLPTEDLVTQIFGKNKESLLNDFLKISPLEERAFQSAFLEYETEKSPWLTERIALLKMYNEEFSSIDEKKMNSLTRQFINNDLEFGRLQMRYFRKFNKLLGANRAAKFFQLDNYLEQSTRVYLQNQLPFIKELESDKLAKPLTAR